MKSLAKIGLCAGAALVLACGCDTIKRARRAQAEVACAVGERPATPKGERVDLRGLRLVDYVAWAMNHRPSIEAAHLAVSNAVLELARVTSDRELQMNLSSGFSQSTANRTSHFSWHQNRGKFSSDVSVDLLICDFGRINARERQARANLVAAQRDLADEEFAVFNDVAQAYFTLLQNDALLEVARTNEYQYAEHLRQAESLFAEGEVKKLDVLKARVDLSDAQLATINASNDVVTAGASFIRALGLSADRASRADVMDVAAQVLEFSRHDLQPTTYGTAEALDLARTNAPSLKVLRAKLRAASAEVDYAIADLFPTLSFSSALSFADPTWNWSWGFKAVQSLLDGYRKRTLVDEAVVAMELARVALDEAEQNLSRDLAVAAAVRDNARESLATARVEVQQAKENLDTVVEQYRLGDASRIDFTDAASGYARALGTRAKAFYAGEIAEAELIRLTGHVPPKDKPKAGGSRLSRPKRRDAASPKATEKRRDAASPKGKEEKGTYREVNDEDID